MRTKEEIERAIAHLKEALMGGRITAPDAAATRAIAGILAALCWVNGDDRPGGFGEMLAKLEAVGPSGHRRGARVN